MLGRSRVNKLFVMRSLLLREEEAHRPELYLRPVDSGEGGGEGEGDFDAAGIVEQQGERLSVPLVGRRRPSDSAGPDDRVAAVGGGGGGPGRRGGGARVGGEEGEGDGESEPGGELRYHRQLRRYREYLAEEVREREGERERWHAATMQQRCSRCCSP